VNLYPRLIADGTVIWKSPTGKTYKTRPGSRIFFPDMADSHRRAPITISAGGPGRKPLRDDARATTNPRRRAEQTTTVLRQVARKDTRGAV